jgi:hypothetical protein
VIRPRRLPAAAVERRKRLRQPVTIQHGEKKRPVVLRWGRYRHERCESESEAFHFVMNCTEASPEKYRGSASLDRIVS